MKENNKIRNKSWNKDKLTRGLLIVFINLLVLAISFDVLFLYKCPQFTNTITSQTDFGRSYEESTAFQDLFHYAIRNVMETIQSRYNFETEGKYNPNKLVDVLEYMQDGEISGENKKGLAYTIRQIDDWGELYSDADLRGDTVIVCQKPDNTYYYYYLNEFQEQFRLGKFRLKNTDLTVDAFLNDIESYLPTTSDSQFSIVDEAGTVLYDAFWRFPYTLTEKYKPEGAENILEVVNNIPALNGKLTEVYDALQQTITQVKVELDKYRTSDDVWEEGNTNFTYVLIDKNKKFVYTNNSAYKNFNEAISNLAKLKKKQGKYLVVDDKLSDFDTNMKIYKQDWRNSIQSYYKGDKSNFIFAAFIDTKYPIQDIFYNYKQDYNYFVPRLKSVITSLILTLILFLVCIVWLTTKTGRENQEGKVELLAFDRWKTELGALSILLAWGIPYMLASSIFGNPILTAITGRQVEYVQGVTAMTTGNAYTYNKPTDYILTSFFVLFTTCCFLVGYSSLIRRIKAKILWKNSVLYYICEELKLFWRERSKVSKTTILLIVFIMFHWIAWIWFSVGSFLSVIVLLGMIILDVVSACLVIRDAIAKKKIGIGIEELVKGNMEYQIPTDKLKRENKELAEKVNDIAKGLHKAVDHAMKSERLKTDLITNVSHDIKTPLTSIINYVDLLKREQFEDPKIQGYLEILSEKSMRLKTLTEDVVEASKVSSGNITLEYMDVNFVEMINQTEGELSEKFENNNLKIIQKLPEEPVIIHVDGRRMWRILENIYTNALKYAMPGTRVYSELCVQEEKVIFSLKNISKQQLNFTADELTERFIRGDISRGTEGSGLGLSIAKSLTKIQGGTFNLYLDGDLFKVTIEFPKVK